MKTRQVVWIALAFIFALPCAVHAHRLSVFAWVEGDAAHVQAKFSGGKYVKGGDVSVIGPDGKTLITGETDDQGAFSFTIPQKSDLKIVVSAGMGHQGDWTIRADEIAAVGAQVQAEAAPSTSSQGAEREAAAAAPSPAAPEAKTPPAVSPEAVQSAVERALEKKLAPVIRMLAENRQKIGATEILGGIGYIFGLVGIGAYVASRRKRAPEGGDVH
jgi:nickel transport protein